VEKCADHEGQKKKGNGGEGNGGEKDNDGSTFVPSEARRQRKTKCLQGRGQEGIRGKGGKKKKKSGRKKKNGQDQVFVGRGVRERRGAIQQDQTLGKKKKTKTKTRGEKRKGRKSLSGDARHQKGKKKRINFWMKKIYPGTRVWSEKSKKKKLPLP